MILFASSLFFLWVARAETAEVAKAGKAVSVDGQVLIRNEDASKPQMRSLKPGDGIFQGEVINTGSKGSVKLLMDDQSILDLGPSTLFKVSEFELKNVEDRKVGLSLPYGKLRASVNKPLGLKGRFTLKTKSAVMGVRGTEFLVASEMSTTPAGGSAGNTKPKEASTTQITVVKGNVEVSEAAAPKSAPIQLKQGNQLTTVAEVDGDRVIAADTSSGGGAPKIVELSSAQLTTLTQEAKVEDRTFQQAIVIESGGGENSGSGFGGSAGGAGTLSAVLDSIATFQPPPPQVTDLGTPGVFSPSVLAPVNNTSVLQGSNVNVEVRFVR